MIKVIDKRGSGKSSRLVLLAKETGAVIVSHEPKHISYLAQSYGIDGIKAVSYSEFLNKNGSKEKYLIDDLGCFLCSLPMNVIGYSEAIDE